METAVKPIVLPKLIWRPSPNFSSRNGIKPNLLVYHETAGSYLGAISWLRNPVSGVSAMGVLREDGNEFTQLVKVRDKAWTQGAFNSRAVGIENANITSKGYATEMQLRVCARIFGWLMWQLHIPLRFARGGNGAGICRHSDLGSAGGGHTNCGMNDRDFWRFMAMIEKEIKRGGYKTLWARM